MRTPTGDTNRKCLNLHHGINLTDDFMVKVKKDDMFDLIDPHDGSVRETLKAKKGFLRVSNERGGYLSKEEAKQLLNEIWVPQRATNI